MGLFTKKSKISKDELEFLKNLETELEFVNEYSQEKFTISPEYKNMNFALELGGFNRIDIQLNPVDVAKLMTYLYNWLKLQEAEQNVVFDA